METTRPTTHSNPVYEVGGVIHYCVTNMPGAVPRTSTQALCNATLPYVLELAGAGVVDALKRNSSLAKGLNTFDGKVANQAVGESLSLPSFAYDELRPSN